MSVTLEAKKRDLTVKTKKILSESNIPWVVYWADFKSTPVEFDYQTFKRTIIKNWKWKIFTISIDWKETEVIIKSYDLDKVMWTFIHVDLLAVSKDRKIVAQIPVELYWESEAVRLWGILSQNLSDVKIKCLPWKLPEKFRWNIKLLETSDNRICVSDLEWIEWVDIMINSNQIVAWILVPRAVAAADAIAATTASTAPAAAKPDGADEKSTEKKDKK